MVVPHTLWLLALAESSKHSTRSRLLLTGLSIAIAILTALIYLALSYFCSRSRRRGRRRRAGARAEDQEAGMGEADIVCEQGDAPMDCAVCLGQVVAGDKLRRLPRCEHLFHAECLHAWLRAHSACPMCRSATPTAATAASPPAVVAGSPPAALGRVNSTTLTEEHPQRNCCAHG